MVPCEHWQQKVAECLCLFLANQVLIGEDFLHRPIAEVLDSTQVAAAVEVLFGVLARKGKVLRHPSKQLHHLRQMIVVLVVVAALARLEKEVASDHLKDSASEGPDIGRGVVVSTNNDLRRAVLPSLDLRREVMISPAAISHIANLHLDIITDFGATLELLRFASFILGATIS